MSFYLREILAVPFFKLKQVCYFIQLLLIECKRVMLCIQTIHILQLDITTLYVSQVHFNLFIFNSNSNNHLKQSLCYKYVHEILLNVKFAPKCIINLKIA